MESYMLTVVPASTPVFVRLFYWADAEYTGIRSDVVPVLAWSVAYSEDEAGSDLIGTEPIVFEPLPDAWCYEGNSQHGWIFPDEADMPTLEEATEFALVRMKSERDRQQAKLNKRTGTQ